ncbi:hypothetical protein [Chryseobacterium arthrosphaerae]|uniref:hypothetical protein n=1 Tax=Chryseobacterium arthrosphaerae TaxID=651561 RepID=UPI0031CE3B05
MYRGFNIKFDNLIGEEYLQIGKDIQNSKKEKIKENFKLYFLNKDYLDASLIMDNWFPNIQSDVFLSHSHKDEDIALKIAGYLKDKHNLDVFVDSSIWLNSNDLLKLIDNKFCLNEDKTFYDYDLRNFSTSHVHMMLMNSLNKMIDNCELLLFLNTPNSISAKTVIKEQTFSPWIYSEIETSKIINKKTPDRLYRKTKYFNEGSYVNLNESANKNIQIGYELELSHLTNLNFFEFNSWIHGVYINKFDALNNLYRKHSLNKILLD